MFQYFSTILTICLLVLVLLVLGLLTFPWPFLGVLGTVSLLVPGVGERRSRWWNVDVWLLCSCSACLLSTQASSVSSVGESPCLCLAEAVDVAVAVAVALDRFTLRSFHLKWTAFDRILKQYIGEFLGSKGVKCNYHIIAFISKFAAKR